MATSGSSEGGFSGRDGFVLRFEVTRTAIVNHSTNRFSVKLMAINRSGYLSYDLSSRPWSVSGFGGSGSWVPDFRNGNTITLWSATVDKGGSTDGNQNVSWAASAGPAGIFGTASTSGGFAVNRIPQVADTPPSIQVSSVTSTSLVLSMPQTADNGGASISSYRLQVFNTADPADFDADHLVVNRLVPTSAMTQTASGLSPYTVYAYRHQANNSEGSSGWSNYQLKRTLADEPSAPRNPHTQDPGPSSLTVDWDAPTTNNGAAITSYVVQRATNSAMTAGLTEFSVDDSVTQKTFSDLLPSTQYWFRVLAVNSVGRSPASATVTGTTISGAYVSNGTSWKGAGVFVSNGSAWTPATIDVSRSGVWVDAV